MKISLNNQDMINSVCILTAVRANNNVINDECEPDQVWDARLEFNTKTITANASIYGITYQYNENDIKNGIAVWLRGWHSFDEDRMLINLSYDGETNEFGADVVIT